MTKPRFVCLTNIPTPYRLHLFRVFSEELRRRDWDFEVWFMAESERGRLWRFQEEEFCFKFRTFPGWHFRTFHFNPSIIRSAVRRSPGVFLVAGGWANPTNLLLGPHFRRVPSLFWCESHAQSARIPSGWVHAVRRAAFRAYAGYAVPGEQSRQWVQRIAPGKPVFKLPNTVNESLFSEQVAQARSQRSSLRRQMNLADEQRVLIMPARLIPVKGIEPFLEAFDSWKCSEKRSVTILVAGDGELRTQLEDWGRKHASSDLRLLGHVDQARMVQLYALSDAFALASFRDANPLTVIEALWAGLPLIVSERIGNLQEVLRSGENGWAFAPGSQPSVHAALAKWRTSLEGNYEEIGLTSARIAHQFFHTRKAVGHFLDSVFGYSGFKLS